MILFLSGLMIGWIVGVISTVAHRKNHEVSLRIARRLVGESIGMTGTEFEEAIARALDEKA